MAADRPILAVDVGATRLRVALMSAEARVLHRLVELTRAEEGPTRVANRIAEAAQRLQAQEGLPEPAVVGVGFASPIDSDGVVYHPPNMKGWGIVPFQRMMEERFQAPVAMGNDATVAALGEHRFGAGRGVNDLVYVTISTGVGGGIIAGGKPVLGARGLAGEVGHILIDGDGPQGPCGHRGCLESFVSGTAIARRARDLLAGGASSAAADLVQGDLSRLRAEHVFEAAKAGDPLASELVKDVAHRLAQGIVSLVHVFNPRRFVVGGGVSQSWPLLAPEVEARMRALAMPGFLDEMELRVSEFGDDAGLVGAVALAQELLRTRRAG